MLNNDNYYQDKDYFSFSLYKKFIDCEAAAMAEIRGEYRPPTTEAMLIGSYVDAVIGDSLEQFVSENTGIISSRGPTKGQLKLEFRIADLMIKRFQRDPVFMDYLHGDKQVIVTGKIAGIPVKGKLDILAEDKIVDFKTTKDFNLVWHNSERITFIEAWGYDVQGAIYQELVYQETGKRLPFYIAAVTKESVPNIEIIHISDKSLRTKLDEVEYYLPQFQSILIGIAEDQRCEKCDYCKQTKTLTVPVEMENFLNDWM